MMMLYGRLFVEPGELDLLADAAREQGQRLRQQSARNLARGLILDQLSTELAGFLTAPNPPVYAIAPATDREAQMLAALLAGWPGATTERAEWPGARTMGSLSVLCQAAPWYCWSVDGFQ